MPWRLTRSTAGPQGALEVPENDSASLRTPQPLMHARICMPRASAQRSVPAMHARCEKVLEYREVDGVPQFLVSMLTLVSRYSCLLLYAAQALSLPLCTAL
jgi:hypothetical protein